MKYLKIFTDFLDVTAALGDGALGRLFRAMLRYALDGTEPRLQGREGVLWPVARQHIDREARAYEDMVAARREAGCKSGRVRRELSEQKRTQVDKTNQDKDKNKDEDKNKDKDKDSLSFDGAAAPAERENRPTLAEATAYAQEEGLSVDVPYFYHYYEANGWHIGKLPIRDWRAALKAWALKQADAPALAKPSGSYLDSFRDVMEMARRKEAKEI